MKEFPITGRVTMVSVEDLLESAGLDLDSITDSTAALQDCTQWSGENPCRYYLGKTNRAVGAEVVIKIVYSNMFVPRWYGLLPQKEPSFMIYARPIPRTEVSEVRCCYY